MYLISFILIMNIPYLNSKILYLNYFFQYYVLSHFLDISMWQIIVEYDVELSRVCLTNPYWGCLSIENYNHSIYYILEKYICFTTYARAPLKDTCWYSRWLAYKTQLMYPYLPDFLLIQFRYVKIILRDQKLIHLLQCII